MIIVDCEQNTPEWMAARLGIPTASRFKDIVTPTGKLSKQSRGYQFELLAEWMTGHQKDGFITDDMARGFLLQPEATAFYEMRAGVDVAEVGFCLEDGRRYGASPDGMPPGGDLEIKCCRQNNHMEILLSGDMPPKHKPQVQGQLLVTVAEWCDFVAYHNEMPGIIIRVERDEPYINLLRSALGEFCDGLEEAREKLIGRGFQPAIAA